MHAQSASLVDLEYVLKTIDPECQYEIASAGYSTESAKAFLADRIAIGQADTLHHKMQPVAVIAWTVIGSVVVTAFVASCTFFDASVPSALFGRRYMRSLQTRLSGRPIVAHCYSRRANIRRWYQLMGFELVDCHADRQTFRLG